MTDVAEEDAKSRSLDILGIKPIGDAALHATKEGTGVLVALISRICYPAAKEFGLYFQDHVRHWRKENAENVARRTKKSSS